MCGQQKIHGSQIHPLSMPESEQVNAISYMANLQVKSITVSDHATRKNKAITKRLAINIYMAPTRRF